MYALAGIVSKNGKNVAKNLLLMMRELCGNENGYSWLVIGDRILNGRLNDLNIKMIEGSVGLGCVPLRKTERAMIYKDCSDKLSVIYDGIIYNFNKKLAKDHKIVRATDADVIVHLLEEDYLDDLVLSAKNVLRDLEGGYAIAASNGCDVIAARDPIGFRTLYYGQNEDFYAFATLKKALWKMRIPAVFRLPAGSILYSNGKHLDVSKIRIEERFGVKINIKDEKVAVNKYHESLENSVEKMLNGLGKVAILLSGGVDSCLLAKVLHDKTQKAGTDLTGYTVGLEGSPDIGFAEEFGEQIGIPVKIKTVTISDLDKALPKVIKAVEERDYVQIETSLIPYIAIEMAAQDGVKVIFLGQGPDELWGGYPWYPRLLKEWGYAKLHEIMWEDLIRGDIETLARENKVARMFDIEVRYPYLDADVIKTAMSVAPQLKILSDKDALGKRIHRALAKEMGLPTALYERKKDAAQHGSGIHRVLLQLAYNHGFDDKLVNRLNYNTDNISREKLGSSSRYGYRYGDRNMWLLPECVQLYFDYLAYNEGLLNEAERSSIYSVLSQMPRARMD